jgi:hypothetical protein
VSRWPRRAKQLPPDMPAPLREFNPNDWQEWLLPGVDPAADAYAVPLEEWYAMPHETTRLAGYSNGERIVRPTTVGIGDRPELVTHYRRLDAHKRWTAARRAWLEEHVDPQAGFDFWIDAVAEHHRMSTRDYPAAREHRPGGW